MARSLAGTVWTRTDKTERHGAQAEITNGNYDPKFGGEQPIDIKYADGSKETMKYSEFRERFAQRIPAYAR